MPKSTGFRVAGRLLRWFFLFAMTMSLAGDSQEPTETDSNIKTSVGAPGVIKNSPSALSK